MTIPAPPWFLRVLNGGNAQNYAVAALAFVIGYYWGKGDKNRWQDIARSADAHWQKEYGHHHGKHTEREHERERHRHGEDHGR